MKILEIFGESPGIQANIRVHLGQSFHVRVSVVGQNRVTMLDIKLRDCWFVLKFPFLLSSILIFLLFFCPFVFVWYLFFEEISGVVFVPILSYQRVKLIGFGELIKKLPSILW